MKRDILRRSSVGLIATTRSTGDTDSARNTVYGVDGTVAFDNLSINAYWARTKTSGVSRDDTSCRSSIADGRLALAPSNA